MTVFSMQLALFDLDNTLIPCDSDYEWSQFLVKIGVLDEQSHASQNLEFYQQYQSEQLDIETFLAYQLAPLAKHSRRQLETWRQQFLDEEILPIITSQARELLVKHEEDTRVIITATNSFISGAIARELGVAHLIATVPGWDELEKHFTGTPRGTPAFQEGKVIRLLAWLEENGLCWQNFSKSWFYTDSRNDIPLLNMVSDPVAVDPDDYLLEYARRNDWPVISLLNNGLCR